MLSTFQINASSDNYTETAQHIINNKTKPLGSLGKLEKLALQVAKIQENKTLKISSPTLIVFAGDHGITAEGVSPYPQDVTWQMVMNFVGGGAAINIFTKQNGWQIEIVDAGVNHDFDPSLRIKNLKISKGTKNFLNEPAMDNSQMNLALKRGSDLVDEIFLKGCNCIAFGEMGIGNTSSAAVIMHKFTGAAMEECAGRGTGLNDEGLNRKLEILKQAVRKQQANTPEDILKTFGGFETAMITGAILKAAENKMIIIIDGFIVSSALLIAHSIYPQVLDYCIFAHQSDEKGHKNMLKYLNVSPLLHLDMRLGEGTGAALALPIIQAAVNFFNNMASFESAGVSGK